MSENSARITLVVAVAENGVIGWQGGLAWHQSSDLKFFRKVTMNKPLIMGRKTFESIGKPLDGRDNIVITRSRAFTASGILVAASLEEALELAQEKARERAADEISIIGGAQIYGLSLPRAERIYLSEIHSKPDGDTFFPKLDRSQWREISRERHAASPKDSADYSFVVMDRIR